MSLYVSFTSYSLLLAFLADLFVFFFFLLFYFCPLSSVGCSFSECVHLSVCLPRPPSIPCASFTLLYKIKIDYFFSTCCNVSTFWQLLCLEYITEFVLFFLRCSVFFRSFFSSYSRFCFPLYVRAVCLFRCFYICICFCYFVLDFFFFSFSSPIFHMNASHALYIPYVCDFFFDLFIYLFFVLLIILFYFVYCILTFTCAVCCYLFFSYWYFFFETFQ